MALTAIAVDGCQPLEGRLLFPAKITLNRDSLALDHLRNLHQLIFRKLTGPQVVIHPGLLKNPEGGRWPNSVNVAERSFDALLVRDLDSKNTCHVVWRRCDRVWKFLTRKGRAV